MQKTLTLKNGIKIVMEEMQHVDSVTCSIWVRTGSCDEDDRISGISHFVEHMMFKGTEKRDAFHISYDVERIGASINAFTGKEATCYYVKSTTENMYKVFDVLTDILENSLFEKREMDLERKVIEEEIKMGLDDPEDCCQELMGNGIFKGSPLGNNIIGTASSVRRINSDVMKSYVKEQYVRDAICVSVAGRFDEDELIRYFEKHFEGLGKTKKERKRGPFKYTPFYVSAKRNINQAHLLLGTKAIDLNDDRAYAFNAMSMLFGGGMSSRLFQGIREKRGLAYTVFGTLSSYASDGFYEIYAGVAMDNVKKAVKAVKEELEKLASESVSADELEAAKEQMKSTFAFSHENTSSRSMANGKNYLLIDRVFSPDEVLEGINSLTIGDIDDIKGIITDFSKYSLSVVSGKRSRPREIMESLK